MSPKQSSAGESNALEKENEALKRQLAAKDWIIQETEKDRANAAAAAKKIHELEEIVAKHEHRIGDLEKQVQDLQNKVNKLTASNNHIQANARHEIHTARQEEVKVRALLKRTLEQAEPGKYLETRPKKHFKPPRVAKCTICYIRKLDCDGSFKCTFCKETRPGKKCKRTACKWFAKGQCRKFNCTFAHEGEEYEVVIPHKALKQSQKGEGKAEENDQEEKDDEDDDDKGGIVLA